MIAQLRSFAYRAGMLRPRRLPAYVVSVGNISMGGTGKSPFTALLAEAGVKAGLRTAVLSRGYGRADSGLVIVGPNAPVPPAARIGDEPRMIKLRVPGISLLVHPDRGRMAQEHWEELGRPELVILDDGFQHWKLARDRDVVMIDATEDFHGRPIPFGRMRESAAALGRADLVVLNHASRLEPRERERLEAQARAALEPRAYAPWKMKHVARPAVLWADYECAGFSGLGGEPAEPAAEGEFVLASGIAKPRAFLGLAQSLGIKVREEIVFPDHHALASADHDRLAEALRKLGRGSLLLTEKDAARWQESLRGLPALVLRVRFRFLGEGEAHLQQFTREMNAEAKQCSISG